MPTRATKQDSPILCALLAGALLLISALFVIPGSAIPSKVSLLTAKGRLASTSWCRIGKGPGKTVCLQLEKSGNESQYVIPFLWPNPRTIKELPVGAELSVLYQAPSLMDRVSYVWDLSVDGELVVPYAQMRRLFDVHRSEGLVIASAIALGSSCLFALSYALRTHYGAWCSDAWLGRQKS